MRDTFEAWKYLVDDFLEMACHLNEKEREFLIERMADDADTSEEISSHPSFLMSGKLIAFTEKEDIRELWIYNARQKKVRCFKVTGGQTR